MKYDERILNFINNKYHVAEILERERGDSIPDHDHSVSCVLHSDKDPSLRVYAEMGRHSYCFSCGKTLTPYGILKAITGFSWNEIIDYLEQEYSLVIPANLDSNESDIQANAIVAQRIRYIKKYMNRKLLNLTQRALYVDSKSGGSKSIEKLYDKVISIKEADCI